MGTSFVSRAWEAFTVSVPMARAFPAAPWPSWSPRTSQARRRPSVRATCFIGKRSRIFCDRTHAGAGALELSRPRGLGVNGF